MPAGMTQQIDRMVSSQMNLGSGDVTPGQSVASGTGQSSYGGNVGARVALGPTDVRFAAAIGTLFGGIYQYVFMTFTTQQPVRGRFVSWDLSVAEALYQVNGDAKPTTAQPTLIAGIVLHTAVTLNTFAWMQIGGRASCLFDSALTGGTAGALSAGQIVAPKVSAAVASTFDSASQPAAPTTATINAVTFSPVGISETAAAVSTISVVQLSQQLAFRRV
jgi:hypothetical protein